MSAYTKADDEPPAVRPPESISHPPAGRIHIDHPEAKHPLLTAWIDV